MRPPHARFVHEVLAQRGQAALPPGLKLALGPIIAQIAEMTLKIKQYDRDIQRLTQTEYSETQAMMTIHGIGHITALTFVLTLGEKTRFGRSRDVGCYLELRPKRSQSGERDPQLGITKAGNAYLQSLLIECANHRRVMTANQAQFCFDCLAPRERLIPKLAVIGGLRPGEIFALTWSALAETYADIRQRVYRGVLDSPKTYQSIRKAALPEGLLREIELWREMAVSTDEEAWVFPSENMTPLIRGNCRRRHMMKKLEALGLGWVNFQVMRRTHATLMKELKGDPKLIADQLGHSVDVSQNVYTQSPVESRLSGVN